MASPDDDLLRDVGREYERLRRHRWELDPRLTLSVSAYRILWALETHGPTTLRDLTDVLGLERSTVNRQVNAALTDGWLVRSSSERGGAHVLDASDAGREAFAHDRGVMADKFTAVVDALGPEVARRLANDLAALNDAMDRASVQD